MSRGLAFADRTAVLFLGVAVGTAIGYAFGSTGGERAGTIEPPPPIVVPAAAPVPAVPASGPPASSIASAVPAPTPLPASPARIEAGQPVQAHLRESIAQGQPVTVGVFGDSFGDGVWSALYRLLPAKEHFRVRKYSQQSTGFTRYASLNLEEHARAQLAADGPVDIAVISFGANDTQGVYAGGGHAAPLMSPEWQRIVGERVDAFVRLMRSRGAVVYWVGLPKMRDPRFDRDIAAMNAFYMARMQALQVPFIDTKPLSVDTGGGYAAYLADPKTHEMRLMRANDGIHMSMNGYVVITRGLADRIRAYVDAARVAAGVPAPAPAPVASPPRPAPAPGAPRPAAPAEEAATKPKPEAAPAKPKPPAPKPDSSKPDSGKPETRERKPLVIDLPPAETRPVTVKPAKPAPRKRIEPVAPDVPDEVVAPAVGNGSR